MKMAHVAIFHRGFVDCCAGGGRAHQREGEKFEYVEMRGTAVYLLIRRATP